MLPSIPPAAALPSIPPSPPNPPSAPEFAPGGDHDQDMHRLTIQITESIEQMVRSRPSQWLWIHRRWPKPGDKIRSKRAKALAAQSET